MNNECDDMNNENNAEQEIVKTKLFIAVLMVVAMKYQ